MQLHNENHLMELQRISHLLSIWRYRSCCYTCNYWLFSWFFLLFIVSKHIIIFLFAAFLFWLTNIMTASYLSISRRVPWLILYVCSWNIFVLLVSWMWFLSVHCPIVAVSFSLPYGHGVPSPSYPVFLSLLSCQYVVQGWSPYCCWRPARHFVTWLSFTSELFII